MVAGGEYVKRSAPRRVANGVHFGFGQDVAFQNIAHGSPLFVFGSVAEFGERVRGYAVPRFVKNVKRRIRANVANAAKFGTARALRITREPPAPRPRQRGEYFAVG